MQFTYHIILGLHYLCLSLLNVHTLTHEYLFFSPIFSCYSFCLYRIGKMQNPKTTQITATTTTMIWKQHYHLNRINFGKRKSVCLCCGGRDGERERSLFAAHTHIWNFADFCATFLLQTKRETLLLVFISFHFISVHGYTHAIRTMHTYVYIIYATYIIFQRFGTVSVSVCIQFTL